MTHVRCCLGTSKASWSPGSPLSLVSKQNDTPPPPWTAGSSPPGASAPPLALPLKVTLSLAFTLWDGSCLSPQAACFSGGSLSVCPVPHGPLLPGCRAQMAPGAAIPLPSSPREQPIKAEKWEAPLPGRQTGSLLAGRGPPTVGEGSGQPPLSLSTHGRSAPPLYGQSHLTLRCLTSYPEALSDQTSLPGCFP